MSEEQNNEWTTEWPQEEGRYWLYGRVWGDEEPCLYYAEVKKIANGFMTTCSGHFLFKGDCDDQPQFQRIKLPELPPS